MAPSPRRVISEVNSSYPHDIHPALVPGLNVEDVKLRYRTDRVVFGVAAAFIIAFIAWGLLDTAGLTAASNAALTWVVKNTGWMFNLLAAMLVLFMLYIGFSRFGRIPLGRDGEKPEYSTFAWISMMFSAGVGIGLFFFGPFEPLTYYLSPNPGMAKAETAEAMHRAMAQTLFHWGFNAWAIYAVVGVAVAYGCYRRGRVPLMSSVFAPLLGHRASQTVLGRIIDMLAIVATLFGTAASLGLGALQIGRGVEIVGGIGKLPNAALLVIIAVLTAAFIASAVSGVSRGIRYLSNINMIAAFCLGVFVFLAGPTLFLLNFIPSGVAQYIGDIPAMLGRSSSWGPESEKFQSTWTVFYWAWWVSWAPFVGIFLARISRGRTIREFVTVVLLAPMGVCIAAFGVFGGTTMWMKRNGMDLGDASNPQNLFFHVLHNLPFAQITVYVAMFCIAVFFVTSADSASVVMGILSQRGKPNPDKGVTVFWGLAMMGIAIIMLLIGGNKALEGLQNLIIVSALPFAFVLIGMVFAFMKDLRTDPMTLRYNYARAAIRQAVVTGIERHGDDFQFHVSEAPQGGGAGAGFDSHAEEVTGWYQLRDEEGELTPDADFPRPESDSPAEDLASEDSASKETTTAEASPDSRPAGDTQPGSHAVHAKD
ncbi:BCCT family transporter [Arthrobacter sp. UM1]|uniref:BCCT family transporter n=1 Tax=Arthrobacter sp. UM1 TaxID=2766776 RepID=UPI001CF6EEC9|nr:BCCT family transporter [Arthrobacter sp. UM1]MCB4208431.1 BCCT family transporter [Arthrobacter sp. UM1]